MGEGRLYSLRLREEEKQRGRGKKIESQNGAYSFGGRDGEPQTNAILLARAENNLSASPPEFTAGTLFSAPARFGVSSFEKLPASLYEKDFLIR
jgi:hypothetical protein